MIYKCLKNNNFRLHNYELRPIAGIDLIKIMEWRNSQISVLRQKNPLTKKSQKKYFKNYILPTFNQLNPKQILFGYLFESKLIGYGGLTNIDWISLRAELSFLVSDYRANNTDLYILDFSIFLKLIKDISFIDLGLNKIFTETYDIRHEHIKILEDNGFFHEGTLREHNYIDEKTVDSLIHGLLKKGQL